MNQTIRKIRVIDAEGRVLGTIERHAEDKHEYRVRRTRGFAGSYAEALKVLQKLSAVLDKRCGPA